MALDGRERVRLLAIARAAIAAHLLGARMSSADSGDSGADAIAHSGVFVSLHTSGELRGCIGTLAADTPLRQAVAEAAVAACSSDARFTAVRPSELSSLDIEVSVLGPIEPVADVETIEVGLHGLIIEQGRHRGLLLPQVAAEWGWTRYQFLAQACRKAGLSEEAWRNGAAVSKFEAEVFGDAGHVGA